MKWLGFIAAMAAIVIGCDGGGGPQIMPLDDHRGRVNDTVIIDLRVLESQGDEHWTFTAPSIPDITRHAKIFQSGGAATFRWVPLASHSGTHQFTFTVENSKGSDSETINIIVEPADGFPRFIQPPPGGTFNLGDNPCVDVDIEVIDEDSTNVTIREGTPGIQGGQMTQTDGFRARWHWCPTPEQIDATLRYTLNLEANNASHPPVRQTFDVVLRIPYHDGCPGVAPQITESRALQDPYVTERDYQVNATITDDQGLKDMPVLHYTTEAPDPGNPDVSRMSTVTFELDAGAGANHYRAFIPNLRLTEGQERTIYFAVSATDNDDVEGPQCDHTTTSTVSHFLARPGGGGDDYARYCEPCSNDTQCRDGLCAVSLADTGTIAGASFCGADCGTGCAQGTCQRVTSRSGVTEMQCVPDGLDCSGGGGGDCVDDSYEELSDAPASAPTATVGGILEGQICPDDDDYYAIDLTADTQYQFYLTGWDAESNDIDIALQSPGGAIIGSGAGITDEESFSVCSSQSGRHILHIFGYGTDQGPYLLQVTAPGGACCTDDFYEDNDLRADASSMVCGFGAEAIICPGDEDWWQFSAPGPMTTTITTACDAGSGDLDMEVYDSIGTRLGSSASGECDEEVTVTLPAAGPYYVRIFGFMNATGTYLVDCEEATGTTCVDSSSCASGTVCYPASGCEDEFCAIGVSVCPADHFCPTPGLDSGLSACVESCITSSDCRSGYTCKTFESGRGCARTGSGQTGQPCSSFTDCAGERICLNAPPTGYCAEINCTTNADCPTDTHTFASRCVNVGSRNICMMDCLTDDSYCDINPGSCTHTADIQGGHTWVCVLPGQTVPPAPL
jgi:PKD repeat protein